jgi:hypothetical protein
VSANIPTQQLASYAQTLSAQQGSRHGLLQWPLSSIAGTAAAVLPVSAGYIADSSGASNAVIFICCKTVVAKNTLLLLLLLLSQ